MLPTLWYLPLSPWSLKARVALRFRGVRTYERVYVPLLSEPALRIRLRRWTGRVTVPVLFTDEGALVDSWDIARYADRRGEGPALFPTGRYDEVHAWNASSERMLDAGRCCAMLRALDIPEAAREYLPPAVARVIGRSGARFALLAFNRKYGIRPEAQPAAHEALRGELVRLRQALSDGRRYLLGTPSYADIAMGLALQVVHPLPDSPMGPAAMRAATDTELAEEFADVLAYRDALHAEIGLLPIRSGPRHATA